MPDGWQRNFGLAHYISLGPAKAACQAAFRRWQPIELYLSIFHKSDAIHRKS
jgi:hypothetical protein